MGVPPNGRVRVIRPGETLLNFDFERHLWVVLSEPTDDDRVAVANFTSHDTARSFCNDACVVLAAGERRWVTRDTCVRFRNAFLTPLAPLLALRERGALQQHDPLSGVLLLRIQRGALASPLTARVVKAAIESTLQAS